MPIDKTGVELTNGRNSVFLQPSDLGGRVRIAKFSYVADGTESSGTVIEVAELTDVTVLRTALTDATSNAATIKIGYTPTASFDAAADDAFLAATASAAASAVAKENVAISGKNTVILTTGTATLSADDTVAGYILYVENS